MKNLYQSEGANIDMVAPRDLSSGDAFLYGSIFAVASTDAKSGAAVVGVTEGVVILPKLSTAVIAAGGKVSWDDTNHRCDAPATGLYPIGAAIAAAGNPSSTVYGKLAEIPVTAQPAP